MKLVRLVDAAESGTQLGTFLGALMREFDLPKMLYNLSRSEMYSNYPKSGIWNEDKKVELIEMLKEVAVACRDSGLPAEDQVIGTVDRLAKETANLDQLGTVISAIRNQIVSEIKRLRYLEIPHADVDLFRNPRPFGDDVFDKFPDSREDLEEAAKCLSLDRGTACVMHLARAMEHSLRAFGTAIGATFNINDDWEDMLKQIDPIIKPMPTSTIKDQYRQAHADLGRVKLAWRLPAFHSRGAWKPDQAREVFGSCRAFMQHVAKVT